jgi:energy-coupling factor transporter ATP-binding protein EcfA2
MELNKTFDADYTPKTLDDIAYTYKAQKNELKDLVTGRSGFPSNGINGIILVGDTGSGKTTLAKMLPDLIELARGGTSARYDYHQITTSGNSGVDLLEKIEGKIALIPFQQKFHYIILDEVDLMSATAMNKLKSVMNIAFGHSIFIMTTNDINKVTVPVVNRSHIIWLDHAPAIAWLPLYSRILNDHGIADINKMTMLDNIDQCNGSGRSVIESAKKVILKYGEELNIPAFNTASIVV